MILTLSDLFRTRKFLSRLQVFLTRRHSRALSVARALGCCSGEQDRTEVNCEKESSFSQQCFTRMAANPDKYETTFQTHKELALECLKRLHSMYSAEAGKLGGEKGQPSFIQVQADLCSDLLKKVAKMSVE